MTESMLKLSRSQLEHLIDNCPEEGVVSIVWREEDFPIEMSFTLEKEFRLMPLQIEEEE